MKDGRKSRSERTPMIPSSSLSPPSTLNLDLSSILWALSLIVVLAGAAALRLADLANRPMHCDEAVHAIKFGRLLEEGEYVYNPWEYHGPSLNFLTLPIARAASADKLTEITETHLRLLPAVFGIILVGLVWLVRDELGHAAALSAALLTAVSPAMVFYSRYYIQEMLLVTFTFGAMVALWRYVRLAGDVAAGQDRPGRGTWLRQGLWLVLLGLCIGMMHATKETCVIALLAMAVAAAVWLSRSARPSRSARGSGPRRDADRRSPSVPGRPAVGDSGSVRKPATARRKPLLLAGLVVVLTATGVSALFFSSFLDNPRGVVDSYTTYFHYLGRASGEGSEGSQVHGPEYYFRVLFWWHRPGGAVWTEATIAALALVGMVAGVFGRGLGPVRPTTVRFLAVYTLLLTAIYSALPYKTPWCALGFLHGMILLAGVGATVLVRAAPGYALKAAAILLLAVAAGHLAWEAHLASFVAYEDANNPYVYAHTTSDVPLLVQRVEAIGAAHPDGREMPIQVICPDDDYWPLPWYLRGFRRAGWFGRMPHGPPAPLIITQPEMEPSLIKYLYKDQPPGQRRLYVPVANEPEGEDWQLRPYVPLRMYARLDLWEAYQ